MGCIIIQEHAPFSGLFQGKSGEATEKVRTIPRKSLYFDLTSFLKYFCKTDYHIIPVTLLSR